ncbi:MAG TPA: hypothetical protein ENN09_06025 [Planctomycetes bacterium]|nr:hypothetical protein [Planctomycetota bacterium]
MPELDRRIYLELIMNASAQFLSETGLDEASGELESDTASLDKFLHPYVTGVLSRAESLEDVVKASGRDDPDPAIWRDAEKWSEVLFRAAYQMVMKDIKEQAARMCSGGETILTMPPAE